MNQTRQLPFLKTAMQLGQVGGLSVMLPMLPYSTVSRLSMGEGMRGAAAGLTTDVSRATGMTAGMQLAKSVPTNSRVARLALLIAGLGIGGSAGHSVGKVVGENVFHPKNPVERFQQLIHR